MKYRPEIDGLRTIAVLPVILFHAGFTIFSGGYIGVDIFFVISGFLITTIILSELEKGRFSIVNFYERRARRIMPMLFFIVGLSFIVAWFVLLPSEMELFTDSVAAVSLFSSNFLFWQEAGYWDLSSELKPLLHTWSLAVEEQFYLLFPLLLITLRFFKKYLTFIVICLGTVLSLILAQYTSGKLPTANFYLLPNRAWELAIGAIVAIIFCHFPSFQQKATANKNINEVFCLVGLVMILISIFAYDATTPFPSVYTLLPTVGSGLIIFFGAESFFVGRILSLKPMVHIGLISYSMYLWHQPIFAFIKYSNFPEPSGWTMAVATLAVYPLSYLSWRYVENPFRNKQKFNRKRIFSYTLSSTLALCGPNHHSA